MPQQGQKENSRGPAKAATALHAQRGSLCLPALSQSLRAACPCHPVARTSYEILQPCFYRLWCQGEQLTIRQKIDTFRISFSGDDPCLSRTVRTSPFCISPDAEMPDNDHDPGTHERKLSSRHAVLLHNRAPRCAQCVLFGRGSKRQAVKQKSRCGPAACCKCVNRSDYPARLTDTIDTTASKIPDISPGARTMMQSRTILTIDLFSWVCAVCSGSLTGIPTPVAA